MKLLIITAMILSALGQKCDVDSIRAKFYFDDKCTRLDAERTKREGKTPDEIKFLVTGSCVNWAKEKSSFKFTCMPKEYRAARWNGNNCQGKPAEHFEMKWEVCTKLPDSGYSKIYR